MSVLSHAARRRARKLDPRKGWKRLVVDETAQGPMDAGTARALVAAMDEADEFREAQRRRHERNFTDLGCDPDTGRPRRPWRGRPGRRAKRPRATPRQAGRALARAARNRGAGVRLRTGEVGPGGCRNRIQNRKPYELSVRGRNF